MKFIYVLVVACLCAAPQAIAQKRSELAPYTAAAAQYKSVQLEKAFSAFRTGSLHSGLLILADVHALDPEDGDINRLYRLNAGRFAMRISEDCDMESTFANCDTALKYVNLAYHLGDSSMFHEVRALSLYQKLQQLEVVEFNLHRDQMPERLLTKDMAYRYIPEERKIFFKKLIINTLAEIAVARGELDRKDKVNELTAKLKVIERSQRFVGNR
jgi:hypothetical protein